jgi:hypothetical protein
MSNKPELLRHVINQFLDEQEALYNKMDYVSNVILEMKDRDHIIFTFNNESQFKEIVNAYVRRDINHNQINVLLIYMKEKQKLPEGRTQKGKTGRHYLTMYRNLTLVCIFL